MEETQIQTEQAPSLPTAVTNTPRTVRLWTALAATAAGVLVAFGVGYAINADDAGAASERDDLSEDVDRVTKERDQAEASRAVAAAAVDECRDALEEATVVADQADDFSGDWETMLDLTIQYAAAPVGSPEAAEIERQLTELSLQMDGKLGALAASADRVAADTTCREP
jgi:hypothetical protein